MEPDVREGAERGGQPLLERAVDLDGVHQADALGEERGEDAHARPDLEHDVVGVQFREAADDAEQVLVDEEVLAEVALGVRKPAHERWKAARAFSAVCRPSTSASSPRAAASAATVCTMFAGSFGRPRRGCGAR